MARLKALDEIYKIYTYASVGAKNRDLHTCAPLESNLKTKKDANGKRHPDEAHSPGEETSRPQQCSEAWGSREKKVHRARCFDNLNRDCADSKDKRLGCEAWCPDGANRTLLSNYEK